MISATISIFGLVLAGLSSAQTTTISLYIPGADTQPLIGSIVGSDSAATTYALQCVAGTDASDCGFPGVFTLTEGPATAAYTMSEAGSDGTLALTGYMDCSLAGTVSAVCAESFGGTEANFPGTSTETFTGTDYSFMPVTITGAAAVTSSSSVVKGGPSATTETSSSGATKTSTSGIDASQSSAAGTSTSTAGVPAITGNARWFAGGAALAMAVLA